MREFLKNTAVFGAASLVALGGIELGLRYIGDDLALGNQYAFYQFDPKLGWSNTPLQQGTYRRTEFSYPIENNALGMRDVEVGPKKPGEKRVAVLGDSFVWGVGAAYGERFTEIVETLDPSFNVLNMGVSGYGTVQQAMLIDDSLALDPDAVIVAFCLGNDLNDNVLPFRYGYHKQIAELQADGSVSITDYPLYESQSFGTALSGGLSNLRLVGLVRQMLRRNAEKAWMDQNGKDVRYSISDAKLYLPDSALTDDERMQRQEIFSIATGLLKEMNDKVTAALGPNRFAVLLVPTKFETGIAEQAREGSDPDRVADDMTARLNAAGIPLIDGRQVITADDFWKRDGHWNVSGNEKIGKLLADDLAARIPASPAQ